MLFLLKIGIKNQVDRGAKPSTRREKTMAVKRIKCIACGQEVNLDHVVFQNYEGPVKCFSCGAMMEVKTTRGTVDHVIVLEGAGIYMQKSAGRAESRPNQQ
jgi:predicted nucleic acid-binding Zn ribbon protein